MYGYGVKAICISDCEENLTLFARKGSALGNNPEDPRTEDAVYLAERIFILNNKPVIIRDETLVDLPRSKDYTDPEFTD